MYLRNHSSNTARLERPRQSSGSFDSSSPIHRAANLGGLDQLADRDAHNVEAGGSTPPPATNSLSRVALWVLAGIALLGGVN